MRSSLQLQLGAAVAAVAIGWIAVESRMSSESSPISISGTVFVDGQPLSHGKIQFLAIGATQPVCDVSPIQNGQFAIADSATLAPSEYEVHISGRKDSSTVTEAVTEPLPSHYNSRSVLKVSIKNGGTHRFDFKLKR